MSHKKSIVRKTFLFSSLLIALVVTLTLAILYFAMPVYYHHKKAQTLQTNLSALTAALATSDSQEDSAALIATFSLANNTQVMAFTAEDQLIPQLSSPFVTMQDFSIEQNSKNPDFQTGHGDTFFSVNITTESATDDGYTATAKLNETTEHQFVLRTDNASSLNTILIDIPVDSALVDRMVVSGTLQPIDEASSVILSLIPYLLLGNIVLGLGLAYVWAKGLTRPILQISDAAVRMQRMEPDAQSGLRSQDELGQLSENLDALYVNLRDNIDTLHGEMEKVSRLERSKTALMQSASHELKTPIAALNGIVEGMIDNVGVYRDKETYLGECKGLIDRLSLLVSEILTASQTDLAEDTPSKSDVELGLLLDEALEANSVLILERGLRVIREVESCTLSTDEAILRRVLSNLISNAVRYTLPGGELRISLGEETRDLVLENQCAPIPADELARLAEPFYTRSYSRDKTKSGTGLGLYIVSRSLEQLGIPWELESSDLGLKITLHL